MNNRFCDYYEKNISEADFEAALPIYLQWCISNNQRPEVTAETDFNDVTDEELAHVLYHAELEGFEV